MSRPQIDPDTRDLLEALDAEEAEYLVVGAHALAAHGIIRGTSDFDVLVRASASNASRVHRALIRFGAPLAAHGVELNYFSKPGRVYQIGLPPRRIDLITSISGVTNDEAFSTADKLQVGGEVRRVLSLEMLVKNKRATGREKDRLDVRTLEKMLEGSPKQRSSSSRKKPVRARSKRK